MELGGLLPQRAAGEQQTIGSQVEQVKSAFTLSSFACCVVHWLLTHNFSACMVSGALFFGAIVATSIAWLSGWFSSAQR